MVSATRKKVVHAERAKYIVRLLKAGETIQSIAYFFSISVEEVEEVIKEKCVITVTETSYLSTTDMILLNALRRERKLDLMTEGWTREDMQCMFNNG